MAGKMVGVYLGTIVNTIDPTGQNRAQVRIPNVGMVTSLWAPVCQPFGTVAGIPRIASQAVVAFEGGDPDRPIILGCIP